MAEIVPVSRDPEIVAKMESEGLCGWLHRMRVEGGIIIAEKELNAFSELTLTGKNFSLRRMV